MADNASASAAMSVVSSRSVGNDSLRQPGTSQPSILALSARGGALEPCPVAEAAEDEAAAALWREGGVAGARSRARRTAWKRRRREARMARLQCVRPRAATASARSAASRTALPRVAPLPEEEEDPARTRRIASRSLDE
nr:unnamed protein product [Digitaria exilis]